jgi:hypothetical protein
MLSKSVLGLIFIHISVSYSTSFNREEVFDTLKNFPITPSENQSVQLHQYDLMKQFAIESLLELVNLKLIPSLEFGFGQLPAVTFTHSAFQTHISVFVSPFYPRHRVKYTHSFGLKANKNRDESHGFVSIYLIMTIH